MKSVSPLLGAVLIIGITLAIALAVSSWSKSFVSSEAKKTAEYAGIECEYVKIGIYQAIYYNSTNKIILEIGAASSVSINIDRIVVTNESYYKTRYVNGVNITIPRLEPGEKEYVTLTNVIPNFTKIEIIPSKCAMKAVSISSDEVAIQ